MSNFLLEISRVLNESFFDASFSIVIINIFDLILLAVIIYSFFKILKGTEASQVIIGMFLILGLYWFSILANLHSTEWLFSKITNYVVLVLVIIFKDDIRKSLAKLGRNNLWDYNNTKNLMLTNVEEIIKVLDILSKKEIGALILIEQTANLKDHITGEVPVFSMVRKEIIEAIFHHESPIHDGAMIIKDNNITYAGAFLPLSLSKDIPAHFGTRHRAGIGISEKTDAIVLIVSEERGTVSIVYQGMLTTFNDIKEVRESLHIMLLKEKKEKKEENK